MNATSSPHDERIGNPERKAEAHLFVRVMNTPLCDLFRGRVTGPVHRRTKASAEELGEPPIELPADAERLIGWVVKGTRLWPSEKRQVDAELRAHFADGYEAGRSTDELIETFGDPEQTAKLIRRAKRRCRPLWWRAWWYTRTGFVVFLGLYVLVTGYLLLGENQPEVNYLAKINEEPRSVPVDQRAWPLYEEAGLALTDDRFEKRHGALDRLDDVKDLPRPGDPGWEAATAYLDDHAATLDRVERAAARAQLGFVYGQKPTAAERRLFRIGSEGEVQGHPYRWREESLAALWLPHIGPMRELYSLTLLRARRAVHEGKPDQAVRSFTAMIQMADHVGGPFLISQLVGVVMIRETSEELGRVLLETPETLNAEHWRDLAHRLASTDETLRLDLTVERYHLEDYLQRIYTDSWLGGGHVNIAGAKRLTRSLSSDAADTDSGGDMLLRDALVTVSLPAMAAWVAPREEMERKLDQLYGQMSMLVEQPMWRWDERWDEGAGAVEDFLVSRHDSPLARLRYAPLVGLMPSFTRAAEITEHAKGKRDAMLVAIALELYHRRQEGWPESLKALTPRLLPEILPDRHTGESMKYTIRDGKPLLYSVGVDQDDDGGRLPAGRSESTSLPDRNEKARSWIPPDQRNPRKQNGDPSDGDWILWPVPGR